MLLKRSDNISTMIESSKYICRKNGVDSHMRALPMITAEDVERCKSHVSGHIHLMRRSTPAYYDNVTRILDVNDSVLLYVYTNFDIFGRYGNQKLKDELAGINLRLGANLSEERIGTNAAVMASRSPESTWVIGDEHYADVLKRYAAYAFRISGKYDRNGYIVLLTYKENLNSKTEQLFKLIESTEKIITAGLVSEDVIMRDTVQRNEYNEGNASNIVIMVDNTGAITFVNDTYYEYFKAEPLNTINAFLSDLHPELGKIWEEIENGRKIVGRMVALGAADAAKERFFVDSNVINSNGKRLGALITVYKGKKSSEIEDKSGNVAKYSFSDILGVSDGITQLKRFAEQIAATPSPVLIQGESGTGKELFASSIHCASERRNKPFVAVNCAAIPKELIGSELFGYVGGSFTGANKNGAKGKFELADGGTLFLDEIGEMPIEMQSVLLRALEESSITPIGASKPIHVDVRIITATNKDLQNCINEGTFRADLYYRLNVINLYVLPLRRRKEDIPVMADAFLKRFSQKNHISIDGINSEAMQAMMEYDWPGNVRELRNIIERGVALSTNGIIERKDLPEFRLGGIPEPVRSNTEIRSEQKPVTHSVSSFKERFANQRRETAIKLLEENGGNKAKVAKLMGVSRSTLYRILDGELIE